MPANLNEKDITQFWRAWAMEGPPAEEVKLQKFLRLLPSDPRCKFCSAPFKGLGAPVVKAVYGKERSPHNPAYCNVCDEFAENYGGGAEVSLAMLFADVRSSTKLSEKLSPTAFSQEIEKFYSVATKILVNASAFIDRLGGDEIIAFFSPGMTGPNYVESAITSGFSILEATGHADKQGPWITVGVGVHAGRAFFGSVSGPHGLHSITALGKEVNTASRLASAAGVGELVVSRKASQSTKLNFSSYKEEKLGVKGISKKIPASVIKFEPGKMPNVDSD